MPWLNVVLLLLWLAAAVALYLGWIPKPGGGWVDASPLAAGLALLMAVWNGLRIWLMARRAGPRQHPE